MNSQFCVSSLGGGGSPYSASHHRYICPGIRGLCSILFTLLKFCCLYPFGKLCRPTGFEAEFVLLFEAAEITMEFSGCCLREGQSTPALWSTGTHSASIPAGAKASAESRFSVSFGAHLGKRSTSEWLSGLS